MTDADVYTLVHGTAGWIAILSGTATKSRWQAAYVGAFIYLFCLWIGAAAGLVPSVNPLFLGAIAGLAGSAIGGAIGGIVGYWIKLFIVWLYRKVPNKPRECVSP